MKNRSLFERLAQTSPGVKMAILGVILLWTIVVAAVVAGVFLIRQGTEQALPPTLEGRIAQILLEPTAGPMGTLVTVRGEGWQPGSIVLIYLVPPGETELPSRVIASSAADGEGRFTGQLAIPHERAWEGEGLAKVVVQAAENGASVQAFFRVVSEPEQPTATPGGPVEPTAAATKTPTRSEATPQPQGATATAITDLNVRAGPGISYPVLAVLQAGQSAPITGQSDDGTWWQIELSEPGWVSARYVTSQDTQNVPIAQAPALPVTPTLVPTPTPTPVPAPTPTPATVSITDWRGEYYDNPDLSGAPALVRNDVTINFDWGTGAPAAGVRVDNFSTRWSRTLDFWAGTYRFYVRADDGVRLWVDGALIIDQWHDSPATIYSADVNLTRGTHHIRMEYYEQSGKALARLAWEQLEAYPDWQAEYYDNRDLEGRPFLVRNEAQIDHDWGRGSPVPEIWVDDFSVRWTRELDLDGGTYLLRVRVDDGIRLWIDDTLVIDNWLEGGSYFDEVEHRISGGEHRVKVEYYEHGGNAYIEVGWERQEEPTNQPPQAILSGPDTVSEGSLVNFDGSESNDPDGEIVSYAWDFDYDGSTFGADATGETADTRYPDGPTEVVIALRVTDDQGASHTTTAQVTVENVAPTAEAGGPYTGQVDSPISIAGTATDPGLIDQTGLNYDWDFGDGSAGQGITTTHAYTQAGVYTLTLTVTDNDGAQGVDTGLAQVSAVNMPPTAAISGPTAAVVSQTLEFDAGSSSDDGDIVGYDWDWGDGAVGSGITVTHAYAQAGAYTVTLTVTDDEGLSDVATHPVQIQQPPTAVIGGPTTAAISQTLQFDASHSSDDGEIVSYDWDLGDGGLSSGITVTHAYTPTGIYTVTLTVTDDDGLTDQAKHAVRIGLPPTAVICGPPRAVVSRTVRFDGSGSSDSDGQVVGYGWDLGDGALASGITITHAYTQAGVYTMTLTVTDDDGLNGEMRQTIQINEPGPVNTPPTAVICGPTTGAVSQTLQFDGRSSADDVQVVGYAWDFGDGMMEQGITTTHAYTQTGAYTVTLTVTDGGGLTDAATHTVQIGLAPTAVITGPTTAAVSQTVQFDGSGSSDDGQVVDYAWVFGDGSAGQGITTTHAYTQTGVYTVTLTVTDDEGLSGTVTHTIQIEEGIGQSTKSPAEWIMWAPTRAARDRRAKGNGGLRALQGGPAQATWLAPSCQLAVVRG
jgi:PKD repeat protein